MKTALLIIDVQKAIDHPKWGIRNNLDAERKIAELLSHWRHKKWPVVHIKHSSKELTSPYREGQPLHDFKEEVFPEIGEKIIEKSTNNAFVGTELDTYLKSLSIEHLAVVGVLTQHSVDCTARMAASLGYHVSVISDATAATGVTDCRGTSWSADDVHHITLVHIGADYASICTSAEVISNR
ncbi:cysteine hydrolase family protein [Kordiimonas laminariae]|uniref:cysteine hydrolase family protein n=1 Tax=Kordiimonas laminariae TaxID=2917717 RepID=UPI001FF2F975|nr:cysteine hydrolase [Kordiimonas laminariae]